VLVIATSCFIATATAPAAFADDYLVHRWGKAQIGSFVETWQGNDPDHMNAAFGLPNSSTQTDNAFVCTKKWNSLGMSVEFWIFAANAASPCDAGLFGRAHLTASRWHTSNGISPGVKASKAKAKSVATCGDAPRHRCGAKGYILSVHNSDCAGGNVPSVVARVRDGKVSSLIVNTTGCE
jgi:hypothetical protein